VKRERNAFSSSELLCISLKFELRSNVPLFSIFSWKLARCGATNVSRSTPAARNKGRFYWGKKEKDIKRMVPTSPRQECKFYENIEEGENEEDAEDIWAQKEMRGKEYLRPVSFTPWLFGEAAGAEGGHR
jgi:hypothetical protein